MAIPSAPKANPAAARAVAKTSAGTWPFGRRRESPVAGGRGAGVELPPGVVVAVGVGVGVGVVVAVAPVGVAVVEPVGVAVVEPVGEAVGEPVGEAVAEPVGEAVAEPVAVADAVGVPGPGVGVGTTWLLTVASHVTSAPPPFPEPLHWSTFTAIAAFIVEPAVTVQMKATLPPPFPELLHCPTVAAATEVIPGVLAGVQKPGAPVPVITEPTHW